MKKLKSLQIITLFLSMMFMSRLFALNDPTRPPLQVIVTKETTIAEPIKVLSAVFISNRKRIAIINGLPYRIGDRIGQFTITAIKPYSVELIGPGDIRELLLLVTPIKRKSIYKDLCLNG